MNPAFDLVIIVTFFPFSAADIAVGSSEELVIDKAYVEDQLDELAKDEDLSRYIL